MASKREQILAKIKTNLTGTTGVGTRIYRSRVEPMTREESPSLVIEFVTDEPTVNSATYLKIDWTLRVRIVVIIRGTIPDSVGDPIVESLFTKVLTDPTVGGLAKDISNGYFEQDCYIWDMDGNLVATSRQLAKILKSEEKISS